jgi:hypothetical protein
MCLTHENQILGTLVSHEYNQFPLHNLNMNMNKLLGFHAIQSYHELQGRVAHHEIWKPSVAFFYLGGVRADDGLIISAPRSSM